MATGDITELDQYDTGVYLIKTTDPVIGGEDGISNKQAKALANRTHWLKGVLDTLVISYNAFVVSVNNTFSAAASDATNKANTAQSNAEYYALNTVAGGLLKKYINIGNWNMTTTNIVYVEHGLSATKIKGVEAFILADTNETGSIGSMLVGHDVNGLGGGMIAVNTTNIVLVRTISGRFTNGGFEDTSYNRGYVKIEYLP